ncbi:cyclic-phosphate processing receiver domain-containing protein [Amycolatopsis sp. NPDC051371]|uniref:cyclic-phosphate processing receiver domain-containing protein n=1 Tax=Amycolatopsis sp. NPDC051371 TaxID=3155800 RepID=UPI003441FCB2
MDRISFDSPAGDFAAISLDHDLGGDDTTRPVVLWLCENDRCPPEVRVHTANPVGREWLTGMARRQVRTS